MKSGQVNKFVVFVLLTFGGGLLQAWVLILLKAMPPNGHLNPMLLFTDGGLYFFSTSLVFSSGLSLISAPGAKFSMGTVNLTMTVVSLSVTGLLAVVGYVNVMSQSPIPPDPFIGQWAFQFACAFCASVYALYVAVVTGLLKGKS